MSKDQDDDDGSPDGTTLGYAQRGVEQWKKAHKLPYFSPRAADDLAERIERAMCGRATGWRADAVVRTIRRDRHLIRTALQAKLTQVAGVGADHRASNPPREGTQ
jgi:hypothetical protein